VPHRGKPAALKSFENTEDFKIVAEVWSDEDLSRAIVAGEARVGIKIPEARNSKQIRSRKSQTARAGLASDFVFRICFGFRDSSFRI